ncbi:MAG TPA: MFS transporter [Caldilineaceae bacterium]|nr:MFS transporter [Caldilineaceae bacterium]
MKTNQETRLGLIGYFFIGTAAVLVPSVMPSITSEYVATGLTLAAIGLIFPAREVGGILGNLFSGAASDLIGRRRLVWLSALLLAGALALAALAKVWFFFVTGFVLVSATQAALSTGINALIADANRAARARALNTLHGVYGVGATLSPLVIGFVIGRGLGWRWVLAGTALIWLIYALVAYALARTEQGEEASGPPRQLDLSMLRKGPFLALFLIAFAYNGVAVSLLGWIALITQRIAGFSLFFSVSMISVFYVALTVGRFLCAAFSERIGYATTLLTLAIAITLTYPIVVLGLDSLWVVAGVFLPGLSLSGLFPPALAYGIRRYPDQAGIVSGTLSIGLTLGSMIPPLWTAVVAGVWGFQVALGINYVMVLPLIFLALYLGRVELRASQPHPATSATQ